MNKSGKGEQWLFIIGAVAVLGLLFGLGVFKTSQTVAGGNVVTNTQTGAVVAQSCAQNPSITYSGVNALTGAVIGGTDEIKQNGDAPVQSLSAPTAGSALQYWKSNSTFMCNVKSLDKVPCGSQTVQTDCYQNASISLSVFDILGNQYLTNGGGNNNITIGANAYTNVRLDYQGVAYQSRVPLGGCIAVEVPNTFTGVTIAGLSACPYKWTYTTASTGNTFYTFGIPAGWDAGDGSLKSLPMQLRSGASNPSGTGYITVIPANYYIGNDKTFHLGIEKDANNDNSKTFDTGTVFSFSIV